MGRTIKRVPLDFNWPLNKVWRGFLNPHRGMVDCLSCGKTGYAPAAKQFSEEWYGLRPFAPDIYGARPLQIDDILPLAKRNVERSPEYYGRGEYAVQREAERLHENMRGKWCYHLIQADVDALVAAGRLWDFTRTPRTPEQEEIVRKKVEAGENSWLPTPNGYVPTAEEVNRWALCAFGHDSINQHVCVTARCAREGVGSATCPECDGHGYRWVSEEARLAHENWEAEEPPSGEGYQLWETVSEGSPISPVFPTKEAFVEYLTASGHSSAAVEKFIESAWAPSAAWVEGGPLRTNINALDLAVKP